MQLSSSTHANGAIKEIADKGLQLNLVSNNHWQWKDAAQTTLIMKARGFAGALVGAGVAVWSWGGGKRGYMPQESMCLLLPVYNPHAWQQRPIKVFVLITMNYLQWKQLSVGPPGPVCQRVLKLIVSESQHQVYSRGPTYCVNKQRTTRADSHWAAPHANAASTRGRGTW